MKNQVLLPVAAIVLSAVALLSSLQGAGNIGAIEPAVDGLAVEPAGGVNGVDSARVQILMDQNARLLERIVALESRPAGGAESRIVAGGSFVAQEDFDAFREEMLGALEGLGAGRLTAARGGDLENEVVGALSQIRKDERAAAARAMEEKRLRRLDDRMAKMDDWLGLTPQQSGEMRSALQTQMDRNAELTRRWKAGEDSDALGELKAGDQEAHRAELSAILTPDQLDRFFERGEGNGK